MKKESILRPSVILNFRNCWYVTEIKGKQTLTYSCRVKLLTCNSVICQLKEKVSLRPALGFRNW